ncbi:MAG: hypothetical protein ACYCST_07935 [Acidimicrobiales bacterium]
MSDNPDAAIRSGAVNDLLDTQGGARRRKEAQGGARRRKEAQGGARRRKEAHTETPTKGRGTSLIALALAAPERIKRSVPTCVFKVSRAGEYET